MKLSSALLPLKDMQVPGEDSEQNNKFEKRKKKAETRNAIVERISAAMVGALSDEPSEVTSGFTDSDIDSANESLYIEVGEQQTISPLSLSTRPILRTRHSQDSIHAAIGAALIMVNPRPRPKSFARASNQRSAFEITSGEGANNEASSPPKRPERRTSCDFVEQALPLSRPIQDMDSETDDCDIHPLEQLPRASSSEGDQQETKQDVMPMPPRRILSIDRDTHIEYSSRSTSGSSSGTSKVTMLSVSDIEKYVMERIPSLVKAKLPPDAWHRIFHTAIESAQLKAEHPSLSPADVGVSKLEEKKGGIIADRLPTSREPSPKEDDDRPASVSATTCPTAIASQSAVVVLNALERTRLAVSHENKLCHDVAEVPSLPLPTSTLPRYWGAGDLREDSLQLPRRKSTIITKQDSAKASASDLTPRDSEGSSKLFLKRGVSFDSVQVRHYAQILADACTSSGPAVGLGWNFEEVPSITLDEAELISKRGTSSMVLSRHQREAIVSDLGYSQKVVAAAIRRSLKTKHQRRQTILHLSNQNLEELVEKSRRKVKRILRFGSKEKILSKTQPKEQFVAKSA
jgi:hypothetical protein